MSDDRDLEDRTTFGRRAPGWRDVVVIASVVLAIVFAIEIASRLVPAIGDAFGNFPTTIIVLVVGTILVLLRLSRGGGAGQGSADGR